MSVHYEVSKAAATFFMDQCVGQHAGHMSMIPNNPVLHALLAAHGVQSPQEHADSRMQFRHFLEGVIRALEDQKS